jgi:hypothetical protein
VSLSKKSSFTERFAEIERWALSKPLWWFAVFSIFLHVLRQPSAFLHPQFWAEDGKIFFLQDYLLGPGAFLRTYAGYLHVWPRSAAFIFGYLPLYWLPLVYKLFSLFTHGILLALISSKRFPGSHGQKAICMLIIPFVPNDGEAYLNLANTISFCCLVLSVLIILNPPTHWYSRALEAAGAFVLGATGPYFVFILPLAVIYWIVRRDGKLAYLYRGLGLLGGVILQMAFFNIQDRVEPLDIHPPISTWAKAIRVALKSLEFGKVPFPEFVQWIMAIGTLAALLICFWPGIKAIIEGKFSASTFLAGVAAANLAASMWVGRVFLNNLGPFTGASRYYLVSYILVLWALVLDWDRDFRNLRRSLVACSFLFSIFNFSSMMPSRGVDWASQVNELKSSGQVEMQALPLRPEWTFLVEKDKAWRR